MKIEQGEIKNNILAGTHIQDEPMGGACIIAIANNPNFPNKFAVGHFQPGEIHDELVALLKLGNKISVHNSSINGPVETLFTTGQPVTRDDLNRFSNRDGRYGY